jgi:uncharacterized protein (TIRG00374 family)
VRWAKRAVAVVALGAVLYILLPRLGGLGRDADALRHAHLWLAGLAVAVEAASLFVYVLLYRLVLTQMGQPVGLRPVAEVTMAAFLVSHLVPGGSAAGTTVNIETMRREGVPPSTTGVAVLLTSLISAIALLALFVFGLLYSLAKRSLPFAYVATASAAIPLLGTLLTVAVIAAFRPPLAGAVGRLLGRVLHRVRHSVDAERYAAQSRELATHARAVFTRRTFTSAIALGLGNWMVDAFVLYLFFLAVGHHQHFGAVLVAYSIANLLAVIPITPGGLGIVEGTLIALSIPFGAPRQIAVLAVIGYRVVNFWLPLPFGAVAYGHLRVRRRTGTGSAGLPEAA